MHIVEFVPELLELDCAVAVDEFDPDVHVQLHPSEDEFVPDGSAAILPLCNNIQTNENIRSETQKLFIFFFKYC